MGFPSFQSRPKSQHKTKTKTKSQHECICGGQTKNEQNSLHLPSSPFIVKSVIECAKVRLWGVRVGVVGVVYGGVVSKFKAEVY